MAIVQVKFEGPYDAIDLLAKRMTHYDIRAGRALPAPLAGGEVSTAGTYVDDVWVNLELWNRREVGAVVRLTAESEPIGERETRALLERLARSMIPGQTTTLGERRGLAADSFTWIGDSDYTVSTENGIPGEWTSRERDDFFAQAPRGLCASDGLLVSPGTVSCGQGLIHAPSRMMYLGFDGLMGGGLGTGSEADGRRHRRPGLVDPGRANPDAQREPVLDRHLSRRHSARRPRIRLRQGAGKRR